MDIDELKNVGRCFLDERSCEDVKVADMGTASRSATWEPGCRRTRREPVALRRRDRRRADGGSKWGRRRSRCALRSHALNERRVAHSSVLAVVAAVVPVHTRRITGYAPNSDSSTDCENKLVDARGRKPR